MKRLLVTGVSGLLGLNLALKAVERFQVTGVLSGKRAAPSPGVTPFDTVRTDLSQPGEIERLFDVAAPDIVVNCAAMTLIDQCETYPEDAFRLNSELPRLLACQASRHNVKLLHISTDAVFDGLRGNYVETDQPNPINVYAATKLAGEQSVMETDSSALVARLNFYGWSWEGHRSLAEWFFYNLVTGNRVNGFSDVVFAPLLVNDIADILLQMLDQKLFGLYHVASPESLSKYEFGRMLARTFGFNERLVRPITCREAGLKAARAPLLNLCSDKLSSVFGQSLPSQQAGMARFYELYRQGYPQTLHSMFVEIGHTPVE